MPDVLPFSQHSSGSSSVRIAGWSPAKLFLFRLSFVYLVLTGCYWIFVFADKLTALLGKPFNAIWRPFAHWAAIHVLHASGIVEPNFVRDTRYLYALLLCFAVFSLLAAAVWPLLDRKRTEYIALDSWLRIFLRYVLAYLLLHYGLDKIFLIQFPAPGLARLTEPLGDYSPSSLMWAFIGSSQLFTVFGGLAEVLGALLLLFRRTTTLGALIAFAVMFNVTVMDFSYDVGVKLFCLHILLMTTVLVLPDTWRLVQFFFLNRATRPAQIDPIVLNPTVRKAMPIVKVCVVLLLIVPLTLREWKSYRQIGPGATRPPLYGLYQVESFTLNGVEHPPLLTDRLRWRYVILEKPNTLAVKRMDDSMDSYGMHYDAGQHRIAFDDTVQAGAGKSELVVSQTGSDKMEMQGMFGGANLSMKLLRVDRSNFTLVNRGFHWVSESSFIR